MPVVVHELALLSEPLAKDAPSVRSFRYRPHVRWVGWVVGSGLGLLGLVGLGTSALGPEPLLAGLSALLVVEGLVIGWVVRRLVRSRFEVGEDWVVVRSGKRTVTVRFDELERIDFPSVRYFGGWMKVKGPEGTLRATVTLEDISLFAQQVLAGARAAGRGDRWSRRGEERFLRTAVVADHGWARFHENLGLHLSPYGLAPLVVLAGAGFGLPLGTAGWFGVCALVLMTAGYLLVELVLTTSLRRQLVSISAAARPPRDLAREAVLHRGLRWGFGAVTGLSAAGSLAAAAYLP